MNKGYLVTKFKEKNRIITILNDSLEESFYLTKNLCKLYLTCAKKGDMYIDFIFTDKTKEIGNVSYKTITGFNSIVHFDGENYNEIYSSKNETKEFRQKIESLEYMMFIDFEFSMPPYKFQKKFVPEIIQVGLVLTNKDDVILNEYSNYIKTKRKISDMTISFLGLMSEDIDEAIKQKDFYNEFMELVDIYRPVAFTWGSSDSKALKEFYKINRFKPIDLEFMDLSKAIKKYFSLSNDISLFNALKIFNDIDASQAHHALTDAAATKEVFEAFKNIVLNDIDFDIKEKINSLKKKNQE